MPSEAVIPFSHPECVIRQVKGRLLSEGSLTRHPKNVHPLGDSLSYNSTYSELVQLFTRPETSRSGELGIEPVSFEGSLQCGYKTNLMCEF